MQFEVDKEQKQVLALAKNEAVDLKETLQDMEINDQSDMDMITELISEYKENVNFFESEKKDFTDPLNKLRNKVNSVYNPTIKLLNECIEICKNKIVEYEYEIEEKTVKSLESKKETPKKAIATKTQIREKLDYRVVDFDAIPREYLSLDHSKVKIELREKQADLEIPGIEIYISKSVAIVR